MDYIVTSPSGHNFKVTAPDSATQDEVLAYAQKQFAENKDTLTATIPTTNTEQKDLANPKLNAASKKLQAQANYVANPALATQKAFDQGLIEAKQGLEQVGLAFLNAAGSTSLLKDINAPNLILSDKTIAKHNADIQKQHAQFNVEAGGNPNTKAEKFIGSSIPYTAIPAAGEGIIANGMLGTIIGGTQYAENPEDRATNALIGTAFGMAPTAIIKGIRAWKGSKAPPPPDSALVASQEPVSVPKEPSIYQTIKSAQSDVEAQTGIHLTPKDAVPQLWVKHVRQSVLDSVTEASEEALAGNYDKSKRLFRNITDMVTVGDIQPESLPELLEKYNMSPAEFAEHLSDTWSAAGRALGNLSHLYRRLQKAFDGNEAAAAVLSEMRNKTALKEVLTDNGPDAIAWLWQRLENTRRALIVTQLSTAMRNTLSQTAALGIGDVDQALSAVLEGMFNRGKQAAYFAAGKPIPDLGGPFKQLHDLSFGLSVAMRKVSKENRLNFKNAMDTAVGSMIKAMALDRPVHEVVIGTSKPIEILNYINRAQELAFRRIAIESKTRTVLASKGLAFTPENMAKLSEKDINNIVEHALTLTFAKNPESRTARQLINLWSKIGLTLVNPFPRFQFANAMPYLWQHSPFGLLSNKVLKAFFKRNPEGTVGVQFNTKMLADVISKAATGSALWYGAWELKQNHGGPQWYLIRTGVNPDGSAKYLDMRSYAPISSYLAMAQAVDDYIKGTNQIDTAEVMKQLAGLNRIQGSGVAILNLFFAHKGETRDKVIAQIAGQWLSSFSTSFRQVKDLLSWPNMQESVLRDVRTNPLWAPFLANLPGVSQYLPPAFSPFKGIQGLDPRSPDFEQQSAIDTAATKIFDSYYIGSHSLGVPAPVAKQVFGLTVRELPLAQREFYRLEINAAHIYPKTGIPEADRLMAGYTGWFTENYIKPVLQSSTYANLPDPAKKVMLEEMLTAAKRTGIGLLAANHTSLFLMARKRGLDEDVMDMAKTYGIPVGEELDKLIQKWNKDNKK